jgi:hypothetical protein
VESLKQALINTKQAIISAKAMRSGLCFRLDGDMDSNEMWLLKFANYRASAIKLRAKGDVIYLKVRFSSSSKTLLYRCDAVN